MENTTAAPMETHDFDRVTFATIKLAFRDFSKGLAGHQSLIIVKPMHISYDFERAYIYDYKVCKNCHITFKYFNFKADAYKARSNEAEEKYLNSKASWKESGAYCIPCGKCPSKKIYALWLLNKAVFKSLIIVLLSKLLNC